MSKSILIFGGVRPLGRAVAIAAVRSGEYGVIRVIDSYLPELSAFTPDQNDAFVRIEVLQMNIEQEEAEDVINKAFAHPEVKVWSVVVSALFENRYGFEEPFHRAHTVWPAEHIARGVKRWGCEVVVHLTIANAFYCPKKLGKVKEGVLKEAIRTSPRSIAVVKAENIFRNTDGIPLVILHLADLYGEGHFAGTEYVLAGSRSVLLSNSTDFKCLWDHTDKFNTLHTIDAARATLHAAKWYSDTQRTGVVTFNVVDDADSSRFSLYATAGKVLGVIVTPLPAIMRASLLYSLKFDNILESFRRTFLSLWIPLVYDKGSFGMHFEIHINAESLISPWAMRLDGSRFKEITGFEYWYPDYTVENVRAVLDYWKSLDLWP